MASGDLPPLLAVDAANIDDQRMAALLRCAICMEVPSKPHMFLTCQHAGCVGCLSRLERCHVCRASGAAQGQLVKSALGAEAASFRLSLVVSLFRLDRKGLLSCNSSIILPHDSSKLLTGGRRSRGPLPGENGRGSQLQLEGRRVGRPSRPLATLPVPEKLFFRFLIIYHPPRF
jgi:hypothetical protein